MSKPKTKQKPKIKETENRKPNSKFRTVYTENSAQSQVT